LIHRNRGDSSSVGNNGIALVTILVVFVLGRSVFKLQSGQPDGLLRPNISAGDLKPLNASRLIEQLNFIDWFQFEKLVAAVYRRLGYSVTRRGGSNPDRGIDLVIERDGDQTAVQCTQWKSWNVGVRPVREFLGALTDAWIQKGIFVTLCGSLEMLSGWPTKMGSIVNETELAALLASVDAASDPEILAILDDPPKLCPKCEREMVLRTAIKGLVLGKSFGAVRPTPGAATQCRYETRVRCSYSVAILEDRFLCEDNLAALWSRRLVPKNLVDVCELFL